MDVLVAGAGPVGLSLAIELGIRGVICTVVERNERVGGSPRAKTTNVRSREHLRRWGIADALRRASPIPQDYPPDVVFATRMNGPELARFDDAFNGRRVRDERYSEEAQWVPQYTVEEVLRARAASLPGVRLEFGTALQGFSQDADGVSATLADRAGGGARTVRAAYMVGADGARSAVREALGVRMEGNGPALRNYSVIFRAPDLAARQIHGKAIMYWLVNGDQPAMLGPMDQHGLWFFMATKLTDAVDTQDLVALIRRSTGIPDLAIEVVRGDPWVAQSLIADRYASGRVFLAGDACHLHPPFGGFGMNMGIGDAVDLGWKLAATLQGWGGPDLLASYQAERRPVHERTIREATSNYATVGNQLVRPALEETGAAGDAARAATGAMIRATKAREFRTLGLVLGARYDGSPIVVADGSPPPPETVEDYEPSACPGGLAPHAWLADGSSLYDHFGPAFSLLCTDGAGVDVRAGARAVDAPHDADVAGLAAAASRRGLPLVVVRPGDPRLAELYGARFALIRPDQHVAWRGDDLAEAAGQLGRVTGHPAAAVERKGAIAPPAMA